MDIQAARAELAEHAPDTVTAYDSITGAAQLPALVVGLPDTVEVATHGMWRVELPVYVMVGRPNAQDSETLLLKLAVETAKAYKAAGGGTNYASVGFIRIDQIESVTVSRSTEALKASVNLSLLIRD